MMPQRAVPAASQPGYDDSMAPDFAHTPVLLDEVLGLAARRPPQRIVDCTVGGGGHAAALLQAHPQAQLLGIDRDPQALRASSARLAAFAPRLRLVHGEMGDVQQLVEHHGFGPPDFVLADFGVSSHQLDVAERGFSFRFDGPLDMRMDPTRGCDAATLIANMDVPSLAHVLRTLGEERFAGPVARALVAAKPQTTLALAELVRAVVPKGRQKIDPATRTFQALRILVNEELVQIEALLAALPSMLAPGGIAALISFHSLEDRRVKRAFAALARSCVCPRRLPVCACNAAPAWSLLTSGAQRSAATQHSRNPRARSARLRGAQRPT